MEEALRAMFAGSKEEQKQRRLDHDAEDSGWLGEACERDSKGSATETAVVAQFYGDGRRDTDDGG